MFYHSNNAFHYKVFTNILKTFNLLFIILHVDEDINMPGTQAIVFYQ